MPTDLMVFSFIIVSLIPFIGMVLTSDLLITVPAAVISFFCWFLTAVVYMYTFPEFTGPGMIFVMFAAISAIVAVYGGLKLLNPYDRESRTD